ncbi:MAG: hypothetical protein JW814_04005 [Candidatus Krumholzibacteriota bacterium]|nr:hypothetical protein [Candidatus Krumholzibacteriota bacterium]
MEQHVTILGILNIAWSAIEILIALIVFMAVAGGGMLSGDIEVMTITTTIGFIISFILLICALPGLIAGIALLKHREWGRILAMVMGFIRMISVPFGTILGIYTIWVLLNEETKRLFATG